MKKVEVKFPNKKSSFVYFDSRFLRFFKESITDFDQEDAFFISIAALLVQKGLSSPYRPHVYAGFILSDDEITLTHDGIQIETLKLKTLPDADLLPNTKKEYVCSITSEIPEIFKTIPLLDERIKSHEDNMIADFKNAKRNSVINYTAIPTIDKNPNAHHPLSKTTIWTIQLRELEKIYASFISDFSKNNPTENLLESIKNPVWEERLVHTELAKFANKEREALLFLIERFENFFDKQENKLNFTGKLDEIKNSITTLEKNYPPAIAHLDFVKKRIGYALYCSLQDCFSLIQSETIGDPQKRKEKIEQFNTLFEKVGTIDENGSITTIEKVYERFLSPQLSSLKDIEEYVTNFINQLFDTYYVYGVGYCYNYVSISAYQTIIMTNIEKTQCASKTDSNSLYELKNVGSPSYLSFIVNYFNFSFSDEVKSLEKQIENIPIDIDRKITDLTTDLNAFCKYSENVLKKQQAEQIALLTNFNNNITNFDNSITIKKQSIEKLSTYSHSVVELRDKVGDLHSSFEKAIKTISQFTDDKALTYLAADQVQDYTLDLISSTDYDLDAMSQTERSASKIYLEPTTSGLRYEIMEKDNKIKGNLIPWKNLPPTFPKDLTSILCLKDTILPTLLSHIADAGDTTKINHEPNRIYLATREKGLIYEVIGQNKNIERRLIPWEKLPADFPKNTADIIRSASDYLPHLLVHTAKAGHTPTKCDTLIKKIVGNLTTIQLNGEHLFATIHHWTDLINEKIKAFIENPERNHETDFFEKDVPNTIEEIRTTVLCMEGMYQDLSNQEKALRAISSDLNNRFGKKNQLSPIHCTGSLFHKQTNEKNASLTLAQTFEIAFIEKTFQSFASDQAISQFKKLEFETWHDVLFPAHKKDDSHRPTVRYELLRKNPDFLQKHLHEFLEEFTDDKTDLAQSWIEAITDPASGRTIQDFINEYQSMINVNLPLKSLIKEAYPDFASTGINQQSPLYSFVKDIYKTEMPYEEIISLNPPAPTQTTTRQRSRSYGDLTEENQKQRGDLTQKNQEPTRQRSMSR